MDSRNHESTGRVLALAIGFFGALALLAYASGVFARLGAELTLSLAAFGVAFAALTYQLDPNVRALVRGLFARRPAARKRRTPAPV